MPKKRWWEEEWRETDIPNFLRRDKGVEQSAPPSKLFSLLSKGVVLFFSVVIAILFVVAFPVIYVIRIVNTLRYNAITKSLVNLQHNVILLKDRLSDTLDQFLKETNDSRLDELKNSCQIISREIVAVNTRALELFDIRSDLTYGVFAAFDRFLRVQQAVDKRCFDYDLPLIETAAHQRVVWRGGSKKKSKAGEAQQRRFEWNTIYNKPFLKNLDRLETEIKERVHQAIDEILKDPKSAKGDTVKRLSGNHRGRWRYRIGDYRLVYLPEIDERTVIFLDVGKRSEIYQKYLH
jgi:mRNA interferase RelE/StbE